MQVWISAALGVLELKVTARVVTSPLGWRRICFARALPTQRKSTPIEIVHYYCIVVHLCRGVSYSYILGSFHDHGETETASDSTLDGLSPAFQQMGSANGEGRVGDTSPATKMLSRI